MHFLPPRILVLATVMAVLWLPERTSAQISADTIAAQLAAESGNPADSYREYAEKLAKTLYGLAAPSRARVLGDAATVLLNDELGLEPMNFANFSSELTEGSKEELDKVADFLTENGDVTISIEGHTAIDFRGAQQLSENRALAAKEYLQSLGIDESRIETTGFGFSQPLVDSDSADAQSRNRRIDIKLR